MKRFLLSIAIALLLVVPAFAATYTSSPYAHYMVGHVDIVGSFEVDIFEESIPFDLNNPEVSFNENLPAVMGLKFGRYTAISNTENSVIKLCITHTPLVSDDDHSKAIGYRLYAMTREGSQTEDSTGKISIPIDATRPQVQKAMYISLEDANGGAIATKESTVAKLASLPIGYFHSTIYFTLEQE